MPLEASRKILGRSHAHMTMADAEKLHAEAELNLGSNHEPNFHLQTPI